MKKNIIQWIPFILIICLAIFLRFYQLGAVPIELNRDEASLGYTAYSLLHSGIEEHGQKWPLSIESFGDWKLPGYVYTLIPFVKIFGLTNLAVKLPSTIAGVLIVLLGSCLAWTITKGYQEKNRVLITSLTGLMLAISPWNIHMSHMAYEANLAMALMLGGMNLLIISLREKGREWLMIPSATLFGLTLFTYHSYHVFTPLIVISTLLLFSKQTVSVLTKQKIVTALTILVTLIFSFGLIKTTLTANQTKLSGLSIFDSSSYAEVMEINRGYFENRNSLLAKIHSNNLSFIVNQAQRNIADIFSTKFLFFEGGTHGSHDIPGTGKMYPIAFIFLVIGLYQILMAWQNKKVELWMKLIIIWIGVATIAPFITFEAAHTIRFSPALFGLEFLSAFGLFTLLTIKKKGILTNGIIALVALVIVYSTIQFLATYFVVAPKRDINNQNWQINRLVELVNVRYDQYDLILMPGTQWSPYIYFLYFNQTDPTTLSETLEYYPVDNEGFRHVMRLGKIDFTSIDWNLHHDKSVLYVLKMKEIPGDKLESDSYQIEYSLTDPYAKDEWILLSKK